ncbi:peptide deformylase [Campylobacter blaseri]|uniref:Peptide deformylase n=1 Tax=Campylobacter blaseri TaxID=2042961 RepID=A0A2P8R0Y2_9BACT|nr:peptide deformylase [Campylobacter blaseri]PSM52149.1 peptide deformylase [Campylobacter blaseri]PSM53915.1 peptide deformylase [Campylobacter blaseri]QKF85349.1 peptide deformylase [Campylobacter blaseri]
MILEVLTYPNKILFEKSEEVTKFDENLHKFLDDMYETMIAKKGIGLAAIQVGKPIRALIINLVNEENIQDKADLIEIINPVITYKDGEITFQEGCLSVPDFYEEVTRPNNIVLKYQDRFGNHKELEADELLAVCIQHEIDHLNGHLFIEKIGYTKRKKFDKELKKKLKKK